MLCEEKGRKSVGISCWKDSFVGDLLEELLEICHCIPELGYGSVAGLWFTNEGGVWVEEGWC